jgi:hypothetical protein
MKGLSRPSAPAVGAPFTVVAPQALHVVPEEEAGTNGAETPSTA